MALINKTYDKERLEDARKQINREIKELKESVDEALIRKSLEWESKYTEMKKRCDRLEKELKRNDIIVFGAEPPDYELPAFVIKTVNRYMDLGMTVDDINDIYTVGSADKKKIVVSLISYIKKREILANVRKLRGSGITIAEEVGFDYERETNRRRSYENERPSYNNKSERTYRAEYSDVRVESPDSQRSEDEFTRMYEEIGQYHRGETEEEENVADSDGGGSYSDDSTPASNEPKTCAQCKETITGGILTALGQSWHPDHFTCGGCEQPITETRFHTNENKPYCSACHIKLFAKTCHACDQPILDKCVQAMGVNWHEDHFVCGGCKTKLIGTQFMDVKGAPFCQKCYLQKHADRCKGCSKPIADKAVIALDAKWHQMCFRCSKCEKPIMKDQSYKLDSKTGKPHCVKC